MLCRRALLQSLLETRRLIRNYDATNRIRDDEFGLALLMTIW
jgi:hypothetical protein